LATEARVTSAGNQQSVGADTSARRLQVTCWISLIGLAVVRSWFTRYELMGGDSLAYLDIAREIAEGHPGTAIHAYWSPAYPLLVSFFIWIFHPNAYWEAPLVHFANILIFIAALGSFQLFWGEVWRLHVRNAESCHANIPDDAFWALGYAAFGIATLNVIRVGLIGPDLLVAVFCFLAGWSALRFRRTPDIWGAILLGVLLALGYYAKAPFFPIGIVFVLCACFRLPFSRRIVLLGATALTTFFLLCAPFVILLSRAKGRLTFGDSARLSSAFYIDGVQFYQHWQGGPPGSGMPVHPTRKLSEYPEIYEFAARNMGTYPAWFDATYWYEGITPHFKLKRQIIVLVRNLALQFQFTMQSGAALVCIAIILGLLTGYRDRWIKGFRQQWPVWMPGAIALLMYALIHVEERFLGGWLVMLFAGTICACRMPSDSGTRKAVRCIGIAVLITAGAAVILQASREAIGIEYGTSRSSHNAAIAVFLLNNGLHPGDDVALIGNGTEAYWAHLARLRLVAEIPAGITSRPGHPALDFWESRAEQQQRALQILQRTGARAVIAGSQVSLAASVPSIVPPPWKKIGETGAYVYFFPANE
jgi:hypothetical protein